MIYNQPLYINRRPLKDLSENIIINLYHIVLSLR